jgi:hypothetical protein
MLFKKEDDWLVVGKKTITYIIILLIAFKLINVYVDRYKTYKGPYSSILLFNKITGASLLVKPNIVTYESHKKTKVKKGGVTFIDNEPQNKSRFVPVNR